MSPPQEELIVPPRAVHCTSSTRLACLHHFFFHQHGTVWPLDGICPFEAAPWILYDRMTKKVWRGTPTFHGLKLRFHGCQSLALNIPNYKSNARANPQNSTRTCNLRWEKHSPDPVFIQCPIQFWGFIIHRSVFGLYNYFGAVGFWPIAAIFAPSHHPAVAISSISSAVSGFSTCEPWATLIPRRSKVIKQQKYWYTLK